MKNFLLGSLLALVSALAYAIQTAFVKQLGAHVSTPMLVFIQSLVCFICMSLVIFARGKTQLTRVIKTSHPFIHFFRTCFSLGISYFLFYSLKSIPLVDAVLLANTAPLLIPLIGLLVMRRKINHTLWVPLIIGFIGVMLILRPDSNIFNSGAWLALIAGICMASSIILQGEAKQDSGMTNAFYYFLYSIPLSAIGAALFWAPLTLPILFSLIGIGILFFIVQLTLSYAVIYANSQTVASLYLSNIVFAAIIAEFLWDTPMTFIMITGIILTIIGGILTIKIQGNQNAKTLRQQQMDRT